MLILRNGRVIDPSQKLDKILDIFIKDGKIAAVGTNLKIDSAYCHPEPFVSLKGKLREGSLKTIDLSGKIVTPGLIDMHTHFREPGFENRETIETGAAAAAKGGLTAVCCMPNTNPPIDNAGGAALYKQKSLTAPVEIYPVGCVTKARAGEELAEFSSLYQAGCVAFSDDGAPVSSAELMRRALEYAKITNAPIIDHCEEMSLTEKAVMHEGHGSLRLGLKGAPSQAEEIQIHRNICLARLTGGKIHIAHLSTKEGVDAIRRAKKQGVNVTCEVTINHLLLTDKDLKNYDTNLKVNPPLRDESDRAALIQGLMDGTIDALVSDHAPWTREDKEVEFDFAPFGISGVETLVALAFSELPKHKVPLAKIIAALSCNPAKILNLPARTIKKGAAANLTVLNINAKHKINKDKFLSMGKNTPYDGKAVTCKPVMTVVSGKVIN